VNTLDAATKRRFDELVLWYVTGKIGDADRAWVEKVAAAHPEAQAELEWHRRLHEDIHSRYAAIPEDVGLTRLMARVREDAKPAPARASWSSRLGEFFASLTARPAYALGVAVIVAQAGIIGALLSKTAVEPQFADTRAIAPQPVADAQVLRVTFKAQATERDMRLLLVQVSGRVVDGPGQLGDYIVAVPAKRLEVAKQEMEQSGLVEAVTVLDKRPARE
jgi:hypothetical protein